ncbi:IncP plasmid survival protein KfrB [Escherichia coli]|nr:conjugal transfer protein TraO [Escherichia coli]
MKERLLVMNGQRIVQAEKDGAWTNQKVDKAGALKPGIYNLYMAQAADKKQTHDGVIVHADSNSVYQQKGKNFVVHARSDFDKVPEIGSAKSVTYDANGKAQVSAENVKLSRGRTR